MNRIGASGMQRRGDPSLLDALCTLMDTPVQCEAPQIPLGEGPVQPKASTQQSFVCFTQEVCQCHVDHGVVNPP